jgi:hypothetical protein
MTDPARQKESLSNCFWPQPQVWLWAISYTNLLRKHSWDTWPTRFSVNSSHSRTVLYVSIAIFTHSLYALWKVSVQYQNPVSDISARWRMKDELNHWARYPLTVIETEFRSKTDYSRSSTKICRRLSSPSSHWMTATAPERQSFRSTS